MHVTYSRKTTGFLRQGSKVSKKKRGTINIKKTKCIIVSKGKSLKCKQRIVEISMKRVEKLKLPVKCSNKTTESKKRIGLTKSALWKRSKVLRKKSYIFRKI